VSEKEGVSRLRPAKASPARAPLSVVQPAPGRGKGSSANGSLSPAPARGVRSVRPAIEAWAEFARPLRERKGIRLQFYGITQYGKTTSLKSFLAYIQRERLVELTIIHDIKMRRPQYPGEIIHDADELYDRQPELYPATRVLRRRDVNHIPSVEKAAKLVFESAYDGTTSMLVLDEQRWALTEGGNQFESEHTKRIYCEGAGLGASVLATKQLPQNTPTDCHAQARLIFHRCADKVLKFLVRQGTIDEGDAEVIKALDVGQFVALDAEQNFDGIVYETEKPSEAELRAMMADEEPA